MDSLTSVNIPSSLPDIRSSSLFSEVQMGGHCLSRGWSRNFTGVQPTSRMNLRTLYAVYKESAILKIVQEELTP